MGIGEHFDGVKQHWARNFAFLDYFKKVYGRAEPLPKWSDADVEEFIASDPVYGPQLKALQESRKFALGGALGGATHLGEVAFKYSKAPHGVLLATGFGAITGAVLGAEVAEHWYQLYKVDKQGANLRFIYWWEDKVSEVADEFKLQAETLNLAVSYVDRFLTMNVVTRDKLQLMGVTALLVAAKYEEIESSKMKVNKYTDITDNTYTKQQVVNMEADLLKSLNFVTRGPSVTTFLRRFIASCCGGNRTSSKKLESMCSYLAELSLLDYVCMSYLPTVVAAACLFVARFTICPKTHPWNLTLQHNTGYKAFDLQNSIFTVLKEHFLTVTSLTLSDDGQTLLSAGRAKLTSLTEGWDDG